MTHKRFVFSFITAWVLAGASTIPFALAQQDTVECVVPSENATNGITVNALVGQKWPLSDQAAWYGKVRAIVPVGTEVFGQQLFAYPEFGISSETLETYGGASFSIDGPYAGFILTATPH